MKYSVLFLAMGLLLFLSVRNIPDMKSGAWFSQPVLPVKSPPQYQDPVRDFREEPPKPFQTVDLEANDKWFLQSPMTVSTEKGIYMLSCGGSTQGDLLHYDLQGNLVKSYNRKGHGPGELTQPIFLNVIGDEVFISERGKPLVHFMDADLNYQKAWSFSGVGFVVLATDSMLGLWGFRSHQPGSEVGHMLTLIDRNTQKEIRGLVPVPKLLFSLSMTGGAVLHKDKIYAVTANTGYLDIIDVKTFETRRLDPHDGVHLFLPQSWQKWKARHKEGTRLQRVRAWQATFPIPYDIAISEERLVILYARGHHFFYDVRDLDGALISKNHPVSVPFPRINGNRLEGILVSEEDQQSYAFTRFDP